MLMIREAAGRGLPGELTLCAGRYGRQQFNAGAGGIFEKMRAYPDNGIYVAETNGISSARSC